ncbi:glycosyltransferase family 39 protein [Acidocella sp.]|uniref:glycosyltransferase family 39 protein n=1 Tax=Acidocella sp. TaxID=50710 RepID=UPI00262883FD|nr:glycosyltransferase family 39 protein [Acidocella sp.]
MQTCLLLALAIRLPVALFDHNFIAPDEIIQYLGQAHRLVYHHGPVPWEYQVGLRSWLIPGALAGPMWAVKALGGSPAEGVTLIKVLLCFLSLSIVLCAFQWGRLYHGAKGGLIAGGLAALWPDLWVMAPHALEEALSAYSLVPAAYFATRARQSNESRHILAAGFLLGLSFVLREQLAPAVAVIGLYLCGRNAKNWIMGVSIAFLPVLFVGGLDWLTWGQPFRSFWLNIYLNAILGVSYSSFGTEPPSFYALRFIADWLWSFVGVIFLAWRGAHALPMLAFAAIAIIAEHNLIPHKEFRFLFPAIALIVPLAGVGLGGILPGLSVTKRWWLGLFLLSGPFITPFTTYNLLTETTAYRLYAELAAQHPCVVAVGVANSHFMPIIPLFGTTDFTNIQNAARADAIVAPKEQPDIPPGFVRQSCISRDRIFAGKHPAQICYWVRATNWCKRTNPPAPLEFIFPPAARRFIIAGG